MIELGPLFRLQFLMFVEMAAGWALCKTGILQPKDRKVLSALVVNLMLPCNIVAAFNMKMSGELLKQFMMILIISILIQVMCSIVASHAYNHEQPPVKKVLQYATVCSNSGFLGNAVAECVYGSMGLALGQIYLIPQRIIMWSAGISYFTEGTSRKDVILRILKHPCIIAVELGLLRMIFQIPVPLAVDSVLSSLGRCSTPLIMLFLGMILAETGIGNMITKRNLGFSVIRLVLLPMAVLAGCYLAHIDPVTAGLSVLLTAMPAGSTTAVLAEQYNGDTEFAANCVVLTTLLSIAVLPLWVVLLQKLLGA
ncbi:MAG: AEC family transporter [Solobacterium sp.]|nr:AEC family transporter [Solobacterium sp.]